MLISVCLSDHNSGTHGPICLKFLFENLKSHRNVLILIGLGRLSHISVGGSGVWGISPKNEVKFMLFPSFLLLF